MNEPVVTRVADGVATIRLNRPDGMNSFDRATRAALLSALDEVGSDPGVRAVVLTGSGRAFGVGQDLKEHATSLRESPIEEVWQVVPDSYNPIARAVAALDKPVIAAVNGVAAGAGASLAFLADLRIVAASAGFNLAFAGIGLSCDTGASWTLQRLVGQAKALQLLFEPRTIGADEALELGLATEVVPDDAFETRVAEVASRLAQGPTLAYASMRQSVAYAATHSLDESLEFEARMMARTGATADHRDAVDSFLRKEKPRFTGS
ncbi:enoyl-CoA hydratase/isomerase family protein [Mariniluteicoccus flavus]